MKFFTLDWWCGIQTLEFTDPVPKFQEHLDKIRDHIPNDLLALQESISLHDSNVREILFDSNSKRLEIHLDGYNEEGKLRKFHLSYLEVASFYSKSDPEVGLGGPHGYGDLGYTEADMVEDGRFEHRILFSSGIELQIIFGDLKLSWEDVD